MSMAKKKTNTAKDAPVAKGQRRSKKGPRVSHRGDGGVIVANTEYIQDVVDNGGTILGIDINPGLSAAFPWLSKMAHSFETYKFRRLVYRYSPTCSTSAAGVIVMAVDYDASDGPPGDKVALSSFSGSERINVWGSVNLKVEPKPQPIWYYVSPDTTTTNPTGTDIKLYDVGILFYGVFNTSGSQGTLGELVVDYEVEFSTPQTASPLGPSARITWPQPYGGNTSSSVYTGATVTTNADIVVATNTMTFKTPGQYLVEIIGAAQTSTVWNISNMFTPSLVVKGVPTTLTWADAIGVTGTGGAGALYGAILLVASAGASLFLNPNSYATSAAVCYFSKIRVANYVVSFG
uniref:Capsid protein n=1 Tax=Riboviria sp. TaxID=2585031 RepID=A0A514D737_9VIRU|nr:MAG: hypothetical protein H2RhizoLitter7461_000003 [Riboviria sp.]